MSDDQLDNDLRNRIKQVFDDYHDDTAEEGWLLLRKKYPEEKKNRAIFWWRVAGVAAFLLLFLNIFLWYNDDKGYKNKIASIHKIERIDSAAMTPAPGIKTIQRDSSIGGGNGFKPGISKAIVAETKQSPVAGKSVILAHADHSSANQPSIVSHGLPGFPADSESKYNPTVTLTTANNRPAVTDSAKTIVQAFSPSLADKKANTANLQQPVVVSKAMQQLFDKEDKAKKNIEIQQTTANKIALGIYAASYVNYAKGSQRQFNNGLGISSDIRLTDNLSISTGMAIGQNTLAYNSTMPSMPVAAAMYTTNSHNFTASANMLPLVIPTSKNLNANLVNLDVPVNLKYKLNPQTGNTYVAAGLSSGTFINESYNTIYSYNSPGNTPVQQSQDASHKSFDNFYFAQMLNLAFGVGYPLGRNQLVIEPFFKYPLNGLGDQHILFGSGGINLKFNFDSKKK